MKKIISLVLFGLANLCCFAEQKVKTYTTEQYTNLGSDDVYLRYSRYSDTELEIAINKELKKGWKVVSITPLNGAESGHTITDMIIVVYEKN